MKRCKRLSINCTLLALCCAGASAQTLTGLTLSPTKAGVDQVIQATAEFDTGASGLTNCGARLNWGDGSTEYLKINQSKDARMTVAHRYQRPGSYRVEVAPQTKLPMFKCLGGGRTAAVDVFPAGFVEAESPCPEGWQLGQDKRARNGGFVCSAQAGTPMPSTKLACGDMTYFENTKTRRLGCML